MTIDQVVNKLQKEKQSGLSCRFSCRAIMVKNIQQYCDLLLGLQTIPDVEKVSADELFSAADLMPQYENLLGEQYRGRWVILTGVSEYLRLFSKSEADFPRFAKLWTYKGSADNTGRIIIPLWGCEAQWHDRSLHLCEDTRQDDYYYNCCEDSEKEQQMNLVVFSGMFEPYISKLLTLNRQICIGLREWYNYWAAPTPSKTDMILLTKRYATIQPTIGSISIRVVDSLFSFVRESFSNGHALTKENCPKETASLLFPYALKGESLDGALLSLLNVNVFSGVDIMGKWNVLSQGQQQLIPLWFKLHPDESYLCYCIQTADSLSSIPQHILHDIFSQRSRHPEWVEESQKLVDVLKLPKDTAFFEELDNIPDYEERLRYLTSATQNEQIYLLHLVGKWMRVDSRQALSCEALKKTYPELFAYLDGRLYGEDLRGYFTRYKTHKLENSLPADERLYFAGIQPDAYDYRYTILSNTITERTVVLWIDGLGAEWLPLLYWVLEQNHYGIIKDAIVAQASLPSETHFNKQWKKMSVPYKKYDEFDGLAHKGIVDEPDYYACVERQFSYVKGIGEKANNLLESYQRVIITGDHGSSRLAARFFHKREGIPAPSESKVCSHGRYCLLGHPTDAIAPHQALTKDLDGNCYLVFSNYDHFKQRGFAAGADDENAIYGEVHGGATPEELLVPVVVFERKTPLPLTANWKKNPIKIMAKKAKATIEFNQPVENLRARIGDMDGVCEPIDDKKSWSILFKSVAPDTYQVMLAADGNFVHAAPLQIQPALGGGDGDLP